jgi:acetyl/propionyl-CoA carboxylase alpha subunit
MKALRYIEMKTSDKALTLRARIQPMFKKILIANRGEIAVRLIRAAHDMDIDSVAIYALDDAQALHVKLAGQAISLEETGPGAYLNMTKVIAIAQAQGCDAIHPGYGFLSERADFAQICLAAGLVFIGPDPAHLQLFGDKASARQLALACGVPLMPGLNHAVTLEEVQSFFIAQQGAGVMIKAIGGGGGRGMRAVFNAEDLAEAYARCTSEARAAFGVEGVYVERLMQQARHIEIQVLGDGQAVMNLGERECSVQRRFQKLIEVAPSPSLTPRIREQITQAALKMAAQCHYRSLGTFEFLIDAQDSDLPWVFIEANPRLQVEHTVTEEITGLDLVQLQIQVAAGLHFNDLGLNPAHSPASMGYAIQMRICAESMNAQGQTQSSSGMLSRFDMPSGPGLRLDTHGFAGATPSPHFDTLLAKLIVTSKNGNFAQAARRAARALRECNVRGVDTNLSLLQALLERPDFAQQKIHTRYIQQHLSDLVNEAKALAVQNAGQHANTKTAAPREQIDVVLADQLGVRSPMAAKLVQIDVRVGDLVPQGSQVAVIEAMKMEHVVLSETSGRVQAVLVTAGSYIAANELLLVLEPLELTLHNAGHHTEQDLKVIRDDLKAVRERHTFLWDANRIAAVTKRHSQGGRTARENIGQLCDGSSFMEYGALAIAAQTRRRSLDDLIANTPADGMITGIGTVNAQTHGPEKSRCVVMAYDYTVLAGTQGAGNHQKTDRMLALAHKLQLPVVLFAEGGGGRPGDVDRPVVAGLNNHTFSQFAALSGRVPVIGIVHGRCFAGNAALLGCSDVIIATQACNIGMGGPAMIEGGGLGKFAPEEIGPSDVQSRNGVIDILVKDEVQAIETARQYLSYFQGRVPIWTCDDQRKLRFAVPENRLRVYDVRVVMHTMCDTDSVLELRSDFGVGILTALGRIEGRAVGIMANNPLHLGGAIDADAADKASRFMQLCNAHGLPLVSLTDTPGFMVGPEIEAQAQVRHTSRMFLVAAKLKVPFFSIVLRKGYGLGAQAMTAGGFDAPVFNVSWPTGEFGPMGLEGSVRLGYSKELQAKPEGPEREALFAELVAERYAVGKAINMAQSLEIDAVIDPCETRNWLMCGLNSTTQLQGLKGQGFVDAW